MDANYSLFAIPVYWFLSMAPHVYAVTTIKKANNNKWNNANPRSSDFDANLQKTVPKEIYTRYERAEAAHHNMIENTSLFIGAVIVGNMAGLDPRTLNISAGTYLGLRLTYILLYINTTRQKSSYVRSLNWFLSVAILMGIYVKAGNKLMYLS
ncbi:hypothetical protein CC78DRAFT_538559 [Lojkania enalia]|uniref:Uncharacterized protein n=1 Tax=Lojkania enalia TaxID=147567 RepID=A0A9P4ND00_9PLEO|nr:hypothetical protein CC78DRAFT_538559 [Didymosphaeria enalia]